MDNAHDVWAVVLSLDISGCRLFNLPASLVDLLFRKLCPRQAGAFQQGAAQVRPGQLGPAEVSRQQVGFAQVEPGVIVSSAHILVVV